MRWTFVLTALLLVVAALAFGTTPRVAAAPIKAATGTRAVGNTYTILWVKPHPDATHVRSVKIAGQWASPGSGGYWEVVLKGDNRKRLTHRVTVNAKQGTWTGPVLFTAVDW